MKNELLPKTKNGVGKTEGLFAEGRSKPRLGVKGRVRPGDLLISS